MSLVWARKKRTPVEPDGQIAIKISKENYNKVLEIADETGLSLKKVVDRMVEYAYEDSKFGGEEQDA